MVGKFREHQGRIGKVQNPEIVFAAKLPKPFQVFQVLRGLNLPFNLSQSLKELVSHINLALLNTTFFPTTSTFVNLDSYLSLR